MHRSQFTGEGIDGVAADQDSVGGMHDTVVGVELIDSGAPPCWVGFAEDLVKVPVEEFDDPLSHADSEPVSARAYSYAPEKTYVGRW